MHTKILLLVVTIVTLMLAVSAQEGENVAKFKSNLKIHCAFLENTEKGKNDKPKKEQYQECVKEARKNYKFDLMKTIDSCTDPKEEGRDIPGFLCTKAFTGPVEDQEKFAKCAVDGMTKFAKEGVTIKDILTDNYNYRQACGKAAEII